MRRKKEDNNSVASLVSTCWTRPHLLTNSIDVTQNTEFEGVNLPETLLREEIKVVSSFTARLA